MSYKTNKNINEQNKEEYFKSLKYKYINKQWKKCQIKFLKYTVIQQQFNVVNCRQILGVCKSICLKTG